MSKLDNFDPKNKVQVMEFLNGLVTENDLLQNSSMIYILEEQTKKDELANVIRYGNLTKEQLLLENEKITTLMHTAQSTNAPITESVEQYMNDMHKLVESSLSNYDDISSQCDKLLIESLDSQMGYTSVDDVQFITESVNPYCDEVLENNMLALDNNSVLTATGLLEGIDMMVSPTSPFSKNDDAKNQIKSLLSYKLQNTFDFQKSKPEFSDLPIIQAINPVKSELIRRYNDTPNVVKDIEDIINDLCDDVDDMMRNYITEYASENGFNPDPFSVYNLTPFPVGCRTMERTLTKIACSETDDELMEALTDYARIEEACSRFGEDILLEGKDGFVKKTTRKMARGAEKLYRKADKKQRDIKDVKDNLHRVTDPMEKFIENSYAKIKKADNETRRKLVVQGGIVPKILRWLKRIIGAGLAGGIVGKGARALGAPGFIGVVLSAIGLVGFIAKDKKADEKTRAQIIHELEEELEIVNEKIEDSRGDEDKSKKYELMRVRSKLQKELDRINLGLPG